MIFFDEIHRILKEDRKPGTMVRNVIVPDDPRIAVAGDGHFIHCAGGFHRLCLSKILGIKKIPLIIQLQHRDWDGTLEGDLFRISFFKIVLNLSFEIYG